MPVEVMLREFIKTSGRNPRDRTQALACNRIVIEKMAFRTMQFAHAVAVCRHIPNPHS